MVKLDNRIWLLISILLSAALLAGAWFLGAQPFVAASADAAVQTVALTQQNAATQARIASLSKSNEDLPALEEELTALRSSVPTSLSSSSLIRSINDLANANGVQVKEITLGTPKQYSAPGVTDGGAVAAPIEGDEAAAAEAAVVEPVPAGPTTDALITSENFVLVPLTVVVSGGYDQMLAFTHALQFGERLVLVNGLQVGAEGTEDASALSTTLQGFVFVLSESAASAVADSAATTTEG